MARKYKAKYKSKRLSAADKALNKKRMGDRPSLRRGLAVVLNWYNSVYEDNQQAYDAVMQYLLNIGAEKSVQHLIAHKKAILPFLNSYHWSIASLLNDGEPLDVDVENRFRRHLKKALAHENEPEMVARVLTNSDKAHAIIADLESEWDGCMNLIRQKLKPRFNYADFIADRNINSEIQEAVAAFYRQQHQEYVDAYKGRIEGYECFSKGQLKVMVDIMTDICSYQPSAPTPTTPPKRKSYYKPKGKKVTKTKGARGKKAPPPAFNQKAATVVYYPQQKQVAVFFAEDGKTLEVKGKTIRNVDLNKSYAKRFGKQRDMVTSLKRSRFEKVTQFVAMVASAKIPVTTRLRDGAVIVSMKD